MQATCSPATDPVRFIERVRVDNPHPSAPADETDRLFISLLNAYRSRGGLQRLKELKVSRGESWDAEVLDALLLRIAARQALGIHWNDQVWVPAFQFDSSGAVTSAVAAVLRELVPSHDAWELATWFITPTTWLQDSRPADLIETAPARVLEAARVDRYIATGA